MDQLCLIRRLESNEAEEDTRTSGGAGSSFPAFSVPAKSAAERLAARERKKDQKPEAIAPSAESLFSGKAAEKESQLSQPAIQTLPGIRPVDKVTEDDSKQREDSFGTDFFNAPPRAKEEDEDDLDSFFFKSPDQRAPSFNGNARERAELPCLSVPLRV